MDKACPLCVQRGKTWEGDDPQCAFSGAEFESRNWNCATMNALRNLAEEKSSVFGEFGAYTLRHGDSSFAAIPFTDREGMERFIALSWYKGRGRTGQAWVFTEDEAPGVLTIAVAEDCLKSYGEKLNSAA